MSGITIVAEHLCRQVEMGELLGIGIFITLLCVGGLFLYRSLYRQSKDKFTKRFIKICSVVVVLLYIFLTAHQINSYNTTHMEYTITVDDSVGFNEFNERYEILSVEGDRYRVVEK